MDIYFNFLNIYYYNVLCRIQRAWRHYQNAKDRKSIVDSEEKDVENEKVVMKIPKVETSLSGKLLTDRFSRESTPDDRLSRNSLSPCRNVLLNKLRGDTDTDSVSSDYSVDILTPLQDISELNIYEKNNLTDPSGTVNVPENANKLERKERETEEDFNRRVRKTNLLSIAQEFAELKKVNADALPFDLHKAQNSVAESSSSECSSATSSRNPSEMNTPSEVRGNPFLNDINQQSRDLNSNSIKEMLMNERKNKPSPKNSPKKSVKTGEVKLSEDQDADDFDVYNMETAIPHMDWDTLEQQLQQAAEFEKRKKEVCEFVKFF